VDGLGFLLLVITVLDRTVGHPSMWGLPPRHRGEEDKKGEEEKRTII
jgi:hypothetical protein